MAKAGQRLPPFANAENVALDSSLQLKEARLAALATRIADLNERKERMDKHYRQIGSDAKGTQALLEVKKGEVEREMQRREVEEREKGRIDEMKEQAKKSLTELESQSTNLQQAIYKTTNQIDTLRKNLNMTQNELKAFTELSNEKQSDTLALLTYNAEDEAKIRGLRLQTERLQAELIKKDNMLEKEGTEISVTWMEVERATKELAKQNVDREALVAQWESTLARTQDRDKQIELHQAELDKVQALLDTRQSQVEAEQTQLDQQMSSNEELDEKLNLLDRELGTMRNDYKEKQISFAEFKDEVNVTKGTLSKLSTELQSTKKSISDLSNEKENKAARLEEEKVNLARAREMIGDLKKEVGSLEEQMNQYQAILVEQAQKDKVLTKRLKGQKEIEFRVKQENHRLISDEANLTAEIKGARVSLKSLQAQVAKLEDESLKQQELVYHQDFAIQQLERKIRRAQGERSDEEKETLEARISELTSELEQLTKKWNMLTGQVKRSGEEVKTARRKMDAVEADRKAVMVTIGELKLYNDSSAHQLAIKVKEKEELMVDENILRLELRRLRSALEHRADTVLSLESKQLTLSLSLESRSNEIIAHRDVLMLQLKQAQEDRSRSNGTLREKKVKVEQLKRRYEVLATWEANDDGEERSEAWFVIQSAQKKEELTREGDQLDTKIKRAEQEIRALENTLGMMNDRNEEFRQSVLQSELEPREVQQRDMLEVQYRAGLDRYKQKKHYIESLQLELSNMEETLQHLSHDEAERLSAVNSLESRLETLNKELADQTTKRTRAQKQIYAIAKRLREEEDKTSEVSIELDIYIREQKEINQLMLRKLFDCALKFPELESRLNALLYESGQTLPKQTNISASSSRASSKAQSTVSSVSASRAGSSVRRPTTESRSVAGPRSPTGVARTRTSQSGRGAETTSSTGATSNYILASFDGSADDPAYIPRSMKERKQSLGGSASQNRINSSGSRAISVNTRRGS